ncbi:hypothetical protein [Chthonobacter rhizosphaerae]|nr:hypothetical protein [Chthonobacter rhizosphaerae]
MGDLRPTGTPMGREVAPTSGDVGLAFQESAADVGHVIDDHVSPPAR